MNSNKRYHVVFDSVSNSVGRFGWKVIDTHNFDRIIANCDEKDHAELVCNGLNVNNKPSEYGLKLVDDDG